MNSLKGDPLIACPHEDLQCKGTQLRGVSATLVVDVRNRCGVVALDSNTEAYYMLLEVAKGVEHCLKFQQVDVFAAKGRVPNSGCVEWRKGGSPSEQ